MLIVHAILKRLGIGVVTLVAVSVLVFVGTSILPGDVAEIILGQMATPESLAALREKLGVDRPGYIRYFVWLGDLSSGDLGYSKAGAGAGTLGTPISEMLLPRLSNTLQLAGVVAAIAVPLSLSLGLAAAMGPGSRLDRAITFCTLSLVSLPEFLLATLLVLVFAVHLNWFPATAYMRGDETGWALIRALTMPAITLVVVASSQIIRMTRAAVLNVMSASYIETAVLKGVPHRQIVLGHALRNALGPIVNVIALNLAYLISGIVVVETVFAYPGLAKLMVEAVRTRDLPLVQACAMLFCLTYVVLILVADLASIVSNPRLRHPR